MHNALVVDDHEQMRDWLAGVVVEAFPGADVTGASTLTQARHRLREQRFSLALIDISLPDGSGIDLIGELADTDAGTYPVITTIHDDDMHLFTALEAGARGYLLKDQPRENMVASIGGIVRGEPPISPSIARRILRFFNRRSESRSISALASQLTDREREVLRLLARGYTRNDIGKALDISPHTVAGHIKTIYRKLNVSGRAEAALEAVQLGIIEPY